MNPLIGLTGNHSDIDVTLRDAYHKQIVRAGGVPVIIPPVDDEQVIIDTLERLDGIIFTGGGDFDPKWFGEAPHPKLGTINAVRDHAELLTAKHAYNRNIPILGICRGAQTIAIALDGHISQDISDKTAHNHSQEEDRPVTTHEVNISSDSILSSIYSSLKLKVNSFHHQAVDNPGKRFRTTATSPDGIIEAIESTEHKPIMGVQWHPEWLGDDGLPIFQWLVNEARTFQQAKALHQHIITLDTHCDTPMFFPKGIDFLKRDPNILVDLPKMTEGHQDATIMVAYIPQKYDEGSPKDYADSIFDKIGQIVNSASDRLALARTEEDILLNKEAGKKSILLGIENGLAIEDDIKNLQHFAERGIVYMTLCHNGDNLICDSAKGNNTHGGVSEFGEKVIHEMNRLGIMVDLSHGGEKSFYDALEISKTPIVCSHSNCKALCDHPRNLTDDQLKAIARVGGVAHTTFYPGFLRKDEEANILDGIAHLEHAIKIMGIDHVGIGTDFDGDGGVPGMACSSDAINFTMHLLRKRFSEEDIRKIWGGNWLRVMKEVKSLKSKV